MPITGTKLFTTGEVLSSSDVNQYLMRGVKVFASSSARDAAYGGAGEPTLEEGEICFLTDTNKTLYYDGASWQDVGTSVIKTVTQTSVSAASFSTTSTTLVDVTGLSVSVTPASATNKVLVIAQVFTDGTNAQGYTLQLVRGSTAIYQGDAAGSRARGSAGGIRFADSLKCETIVFLDSPATTSSTTYKIQARVSTGTLYLNRTNTDTDTATYARVPSSITVIEVVA